MKLNWIEESSVNAFLEHYEEHNLVWVVETGVICNICTFS